MRMLLKQLMFIIQNYFIQKDLMVNVNIIKCPWRQADEVEVSNFDQSGVREFLLTLVSALQFLIVITLLFWKNIVSKFEIRWIKCYDNCSNFNNLPDTSRMILIIWAYSSEHCYICTKFVVFVPRRPTWKYGSKIACRTRRKISW